MFPHGGACRRTPNTFDSHRLVWLAGERDVQDAVVEALFRARFTDGRDLADRPTLEAVAVENGLDAAEVNDLLASGRDGDEGMAYELKAFRLGVSGVPVFVFNGSSFLSVAPSPETFRAAIDGHPRRIRSMRAKWTRRRGNAAAERLAELPGGVAMRRMLVSQTLEDWPKLLPIWGARQRRPMRSR